MTAQRKLAWRLVGAVAIAFVASLALTWVLHARMTENEIRSLFDNVFSDVSVDIRWRVDTRMLRQAMVARDKLYEMRDEAWWNDPDESSRRLRAFANELGVDEICIANEKGILTHSARRDEVNSLDFTKAEGQAREFAELLHDKCEITQSFLPSSIHGEMVKYVGVWVPDGGFVQVGVYDKTLRDLARTAVIGITNDWHVTGGDGGIYITNGKGTIISHPVSGHEGGQWKEPGDDYYYEKRMIEGFPVYIVIPKETAVVERRVLVVTSAFLNGMALVLAAILVGIVIASYVRSQLNSLRAKEMGMAADIQENALPRTFPPFPEEKRIDIFADMRPAKDIGGDFYDFYFSNPHSITFLVADVSGKGVPAALFMMRAKATIKGIAQTGKPLADVVYEANEALSNDNDANMFVTAWIGDIDLETGVVTYVNAGHNPPIILSGKKEEDGSRAKYLRSKPGLVLGAMAGMKYKSQTVTLEPGDALYLYTDGITEQHDQKKELFGEERLLRTLNEMLANGTPLFSGPRSLVVGTVLGCVHAHSLGVEQADDRTQLVLRYNGTRPEGNPKV